MESPASRGCGLKRILNPHEGAKVYVTRFTRVWIETFWHIQQYRRLRVTRFTRVWIETPDAEPTTRPAAVTRFTRVWIETQLSNRALASVLRHPLHAGVD